MKSFQDIRTKVNCTFTEILNASLDENHVAIIKEDSTRIEEHLRKLVSIVANNFKGERGNAYVNFSKKIKEVAVRESELQSIRDIEQELSSLRVQSQHLLEKNGRAEKLCEELCQRLGEAVTESNKVYLEIEKLKANN